MDTTLLVVVLVGAALLVALGVLIGVLVSTRRAVRDLAEEQRAREIGMEGFRKEVVEGSTASLRAEICALRERLDGALGGLATGIAGIGEGLADLREAVGAVEAPPAPGRAAEEVAPLIEQAVDALDARLREIGRALAVEKVLTVEESVNRVLTDRGFAEVALLEDPVREGERTKVMVTARRDGMMYKGPVLLDGARVVEQRLRPSYPMFP